MDNEIPRRPAHEESSLSVQARGTLHTVFYNDRGLRAGWRLVIYILLVAIFSTLVNLALDKIFHLPKTATPAPWQFFLQESLLFILVFLPACVMAQMERRPVGDYGLPLDSLFGVRFWQGCVLGVVEVVVLMGCIAIFGGYSFGPLNVHGAAIFKWALFWALFFVVVGLFEEFTFRGFLMQGLAMLFGGSRSAWIVACLLQGALFGLAHAYQNPLGIAITGTLGVLMGLLVLATGRNLWPVIIGHGLFDASRFVLFYFEGPPTG